MIISIGGIFGKAEISGDHLDQLKKGVQKIFSGFVSQSAESDFSLRLIPVPPVPLSSILHSSDLNELTRITQIIENRFPFTQLPLQWKGNRDFPEKKLSKNLGNFSHYLSKYQTKKISVVPDRSFILFFDHDMVQGEAIIVGNTVREYVASFSLAVQAGFSLAASCFNAVMFHAGSVSLNGSGYLFPGVSGAGKSTLAASFPEHAVLADDCTFCIRRQENYHISSTPFLQRPEHNDINKNVIIPLDKILFLVQDKKNYIEEISQETAMIKILHNHIHFFRFFSKKSALQTFFIVEDIVKKAVSCNLRFTRGFEPSVFSEDLCYEKKQTI